MAKAASVVFVVMAGGRGERLWPLVTPNSPKVCLSPDGKASLLQSTVDRLSPVSLRGQWLFVTAADQAKLIRRALRPAYGRSLLLEPEGKNTAAAIALAALNVARKDPDAVLVVVPADHWIGDVEAFRRCVAAAIEAARRHETIVTVGIRPTHPHTGLGYICTGGEVERHGGVPVRALERFVEKPSHDKAVELLKRPGTYWNSGMFIATARTFLAKLTEWLPEHMRVLAAIQLNPGQIPSARVKAAYRSLQSVSFDHGVMDHLDGGLVVDGRFAWTDLGSWDAWASLSANVSSAVIVDSSNITVVSQHPHIVAAIGVKDLVIVHTPEATLICPPGKAQLVREVVKQLKSRKPAKTGKKR